MTFSADIFILERYDISSDTIDIIAAPVDDSDGLTDHYYFGDFDGDNYTDLICHDSVTGDVGVCTSLHPTKPCVLSEYSQFCYKDGAYVKTLSVGQFQSTKQHDTLSCLNRNTGLYVIRNTHDWNNPLTHNLNKAFCVNGQLMFEDFQHDGLPDLICHEKSTPSAYGLRSNGDGSFDPQSLYPLPTSWCNLNGEHYTMGDFNGDGMVDLFCLDVQSGSVATLLAEEDGSYVGGNTRHNVNARFCIWTNSSEIELKVGDVTGDGTDDVICHNMLTGEIEITYGSTGKLLPYINGTKGQGIYKQCFLEINQRVLLLIIREVAAVVVETYCRLMSICLLFYFSDGHIFSQTNKIINDFCSKPSEKLFVENIGADTSAFLICLTGK